MMKNVYICCAIVTAIGGVIHLMPEPDKANKISEEKLANMVPREMRGREFVRGSGGRDATYKMDEESYKVLEYPSAICRQFEDGGDLYDVVIISSRSKDAFHDPNICFAAQKWAIEKRTPMTFKTKTRGEMPITVVSMFNEQTRRQLAAYIYKGPGGYYNDTNKLKLAFLKEELSLGNNLDGVFYRFIPYFKEREMTEAQQQERLLEFVSEYMDATSVTSEGKL